MKTGNHCPKRSLRASLLRSLPVRPGGSEAEAWVVGLDRRMHMEGQNHLGCRTCSTKYSRRRSQSRNTDATACRSGRELLEHSASWERG